MKCVIFPFHRCVVLKALTENVFKTLSLFPADNNSDPDLPLFGVVVGGAGGVVFLSVTVTVLSVACIYCCKRRHRQLIVATSADRSGSGVTNGDDVRLLTMRQRELTSPASTLPGSAPPTLPTLPLENLNMAFVTHITPRELAALYEREDTGCVVDRSLSCTPDLPPRTDDMLQIVTSDCCFTDAQWTLSTESTIPLSQLPLSPSQLNTPPFEHNSSPPSTSSCFLSSSQPTSSLTGLQASSPPLYPHSSSTPHLHSVSHPPSSPQSHISPSHSQPSTSPPLQKSQVSHTSLPHHTSHTQLSSSHQQLSTSPKLPSRSTSPLPPPIPPKPETRFQSTSDSDHDTATGSSYCILMKGPPQLPLVTLPENTSSNKQERILLSLLGQPLNQETTQSPGETGVTQTWDSPSFLEDSLNQNTRANGEELSPPPRPPKPTPSSPKTAAHSNTGKPAPPTPPLAGGSTSSSGRKTRAPVTLTTTQLPVPATVSS
jgi:hypothetical protein